MRYKAYIYVTNKTETIDGVKWRKLRKGTVEYDADGEPWVLESQVVVMPDVEVSSYE